jgi:hypothetical protein
MPGRKQPPEYAEARKALSRHLFRHHAGATGEGMLSNRMDQHEELHRVAIRIGLELGHKHEPCGEREGDIELAFRVLKEGEQQHGESDATSNA